MRKMIQLVFIFVLIYILLQALYSGYYLFKGRQLTQKTYTGQKLLGENNKETFKILFDGDSVGAGVGATSFEKSVAGRVALSYSQDYRVELINNSISGSRMRDLVKKEITNDMQDLTVLVISSNDLFNFTNLTDLKKDTEIVIEKYIKISKRLIIIGPGRVFDGTATPLILKPVYKVVGKNYSKIIFQLAEKYENVVYVNPLNFPTNHSVYGNTEAYDNFHPNDQGHKVWFDLLSPFL
jgi:lysophospholipase L1-like esterase